MTELETPAALAERYLDMVYRICLNALGNIPDAEDAAQNVMLRLCRQQRPFETDDHARFWLIRVALNESRRLAARRRPSVALDEARDHAIPTFELTRQSALFEAVQSLTEKYRTAVYLYYYEELSVREIAKATGASETSVQTRLARARAKLKELLKEEWNDDEA